MARRIIQFGTSRFLQAHADLFVHEAREAGQDIGPITVVKTTRGHERDGRVAAFGSPAGYPVIIRGRISNVTIEDQLIVKSVEKALMVERDWSELRTLFAYDAEIIFSNVGESGYTLQNGDRIDAPISFPAILLSLLHARFQAGGNRLLILPCELVSENGKVLRKILAKLAEEWKLGKTFGDWLETKIVICDTLVDRIVSEAIDPVGAIAEPYALWAIKREPTYDIPFIHPAVVVTDDLEPYLRLKLHILNLGHSFLAEIWLTEKRPHDETVREILSDVEIKTRLLELYDKEVLPGFAAHGVASAASQYIATTLERFENPFLNHRISDIAQNHPLKIERRVADFIDWIVLRNPSAQIPNLKALVENVRDRVD